MELRTSTLEIVTEKVEKFLRDLTLDELYLLRGMTKEDRLGRSVMLSKIDALIIYQENGPKSTAENIQGIF